MEGGAAEKEEGLRRRASEEPYRGRGRATYFATERTRLAECTKGDQEVVALLFRSQLSADQIMGACARFAD